MEKMGIAEFIFLILTLLSGMFSIFCFALNVPDRGFILMIISFVCGMITIYFSCKEADK